MRWGHMGGGGGGSSSWQCHHGQIHHSDKSPHTNTHTCHWEGVNKNAPLEGAGGGGGAVTAHMSKHTHGAY